MARLDIRVKFLDAIKMVLRAVWLPFVLAAALLTYRDQMDLETFRFLIILMGGCATVASLLVYAIPSLSLTKDGIAFKNWRGRDVLCGWDENIAIKSGKHGSVPIYNFKIVERRKNYQIPRIIFTYQDVKAFIEIHVPSGHPLYDLI